MRFIAGLLLLVTLPAWGQGSASLTWIPPTKNTDGSSLTDLAGYKIYWGPTSGNYTSSVNLTNPNLSSYVVSPLAAGTWFFVVSAVNANNAQSDFSNVASKTISSVPQTIAGPVFNQAITKDSMVLIEAGSVVAGRDCDQTQQIIFGGKTYMRVNAASVTPFAGQQILAAWAVCQ